jgi:hypothetical protein
MRKSARWLAAAALVTLCAWAGNRAAHIGWASYQSIEARTLLDKWMARGTPIDQLVWNRAREGLVTALEWDPDNPVYHEAFGNLYMVRLAKLPGSREAMRPYFALVLRHYLKAAALRPAWPYTHASIATVKQLLDETDADFRLAIVLASRYGPWESAVHERLIAVGYRSWAALGEPEREAIRGNLRRALQYRPKETTALLATLQPFAPPCAELRLEQAEQTRLPGACALFASGSTPSSPANARRRNTR